MANAKLQIFIKHKKRKRGNNMTREFFTSESVTEGHPDKVCDQISDAILDAILTKDKDARVACETAACRGLILIMGEITTNCCVDYQKIARKTLQEIGYTEGEYGFDCENGSIITSINEQSTDIAIGVNNSYEDRIGDATKGLGAGDQGLMFGYACDETKELMPMPISLAHKLTRQLAKARKNKDIEYLRPDGKAQVTVEYFNKKPVRVDAIVVSAQHDDNVDIETIRKDVLEKVIQQAIPSNLIDEYTSVLINPTGRFVAGGAKADAGLTGRKIIVDTYGGFARHGGGAFSGKDPTKVDRSASYIARYAAKNIVAARLATRCEIQLAYAIGVAEPVSVSVNTYGTGIVSDIRLVKLVRDNFNLTPSGIIQELELKQPIYKQVASYGHFGRDDLDLPWEKIDKKSILLGELAEEFYS